MSKEQFLKELRVNLRTMSVAEINDIVKYYEDYFYDAGPENEQKVIEELKSPEALARQLLAESAIKDMENKKAKGGKAKVSSLWFVLAAICTSPVWFPIGIALAAVLFALIIVVFALLFVLAVVAVCMALAGIITVVAGFVVLAGSASNGVLALGVGMITMAVGLLAFALVMMLFKLTYSAIVSICRKKVRKGGSNYEKAN